MSGGKGGSTSTELPEYLQTYQKQLMREAQNVADIGYLPYTGPEIAAVNPWEEVAGANQAQMSRAFNMGSPSGSIASRMPETVSSGGVEGYSSFPIFEQAVASLAEVAPEFDQRYRTQLNVPQFGSVYEPGSAAAELEAIGGIGDVGKGPSGDQLMQLGALLSSRGSLRGSTGSNALMGLAGMSGRGLLGFL